MRAPHIVDRGTLGVFAPASGFDEARFDAGCTILRDLGFEVHVHPQARLRTGYFAGDDQTRVDALHDLLDDDTIDGLIAARGGYGVHRLLPLVDPDRIERANKPIVGFSDLTALHAVAQNRGLVSLHGPVVVQLDRLPPEDLSGLADALAGRWPERVIATDTIVSGRATGPLIGGCLSVLTPLVGTPYLPPLDGAILMLEDVGEPPYRVDRQLTHLELAGVFDQLAGIVVGEFVNCRAPRPDEPTITDVLHERLGRRTIPVLAGLPFGHGTRNLTLPLGARAELDADAGTLSILGTP